MTEIEKDGRVYFKSDMLDKSGIITHCFTSKSGGESRGRIKGLNLGFRVGDDFEAVRANYMHIAADMGFAFEKITAAKQTHSVNIKKITYREAGCGVSRLSETFECDGMVTSCQGIALAVFYADCVPILLADETAGVVAAVHSGWRGTVGRIPQNAIRIMTEDFGAEPSRIKAAIGPSIGPCCFETGGEVACEFDKDLCTALQNGKFKVDLWEANRRLLLKSGLKLENIDLLGLCTVCNSESLYSYRVHKENTGRMGAFIMLK